MNTIAVFLIFIAILNGWIACMDGVSPLALNAFASGFTAALALVHILIRWGGQ